LHFLISNYNYCLFITATQEADLAIGMSQGASIKVISTKDGIQREVTYASLDQKAKEEVLTDLLVKSAVHYAMKKQQVCVVILFFPLSDKKG